jgi:hypothetical protein
MKYFFSKTAIQRGYGIDHNKRVLRLTRAEHEKIKAGETCIFRADRPAHKSRVNDPAAYLRIVKYYPNSNLYAPRLPGAKELREGIKLMK